jgi:hypothetical protein
MRPRWRCAEWLRNITLPRCPAATAKPSRKSFRSRARDDVHFRRAVGGEAARGRGADPRSGQLACQSWNERMWSDGGPIDPSPTIDQAINGGFPWLEIKCSLCQTPRDVDLCALPHVPTTCVHDLARRLVCQKCKKAGKRPAATMLQLAPRPRQPPPEDQTQN